jgi:selenide,water dikinase
MGGKPILALNIVCFPTCLPIDILGEILRGGADKVAEAGAVIVGGHSVDDNEPKYGLSVAGIVHPKKVLRNCGCKAGDVLILTKPLGTGIINTAVKGNLASNAVYREAVETMSALNKYAAEVIEKYPISACTDITGFGLAGHAYEMASSSNVTFRLIKENIPYLKAAEEYAKMGLVPGGTYNNKKYIEGKYNTSGLPEWLEDIIFDPQTSGGLLFSCSKEAAEEIMKELNQLGQKKDQINVAQKAAIIGEVVSAEDKIIIV